MNRNQNYKSERRSALVELPIILEVLKDGSSKTITGIRKTILERTGHSIHHDTIKRCIDSLMTLNLVKEDYEGPFTRYRINPTAKQASAYDLLFSISIKDEMAKYFEEQEKYLVFPNLSISFMSPNLLLRDKKGRDIITVECFEEEFIENPYEIIDDILRYSDFCTRIYLAVPFRLFDSMLKEAIEKSKIGLFVFKHGQVTLEKESSDFSWSSEKEKRVNLAIKLSNIHFDDEIADLEKRAREIVMLDELKQIKSTLSEYKEKYGDIYEYDPARAWKLDELIHKVVDKKIQILEEGVTEEREELVWFEYHKKNATKLFEIYSQLVDLTDKDSLSKKELDKMIDLKEDLEDLIMPYNSVYELKTPEIFSLLTKIQAKLDKFENI